MEFSPFVFIIVPVIIVVKSSDLKWEGNFVVGKYFYKMWRGITDYGITDYR
jgi:hypothetical protein